MVEFIVIGLLVLVLVMVFIVWKADAVDEDKAEEALSKAGESVKSRLSKWWRKIKS